jgi:two-component system response regulator CpxR
MPHEETEPIVAGRLLLIDDDTELSDLVGQYLKPEGFEIEVARDGHEGLNRALTCKYAMILLDVMLPGINGFEVLRRIRTRSEVPVLMLTARGEAVDRIVGLEIGADDYLPKPFEPRELAARIHAILRRTGRSADRRDAMTSAVRLIAGDIELDPAGRTVHHTGQALELTGVEFTLLEVFLRNAGRVIEREELSKIVLGRQLQPYDRSLDVHVSNLRKKLSLAGSPHERIKTIRGLGYIFTTPSTSAADDATDAE